LQNNTMVVAIAERGKPVKPLQHTVGRRARQYGDLNHLQESRRQRFSLLRTEISGACACCAFAVLAPEASFCPDERITTRAANLGLEMDRARIAIVVAGRK
jgi:hypothetical protein